MLYQDSSVRKVHKYTFELPYINVEIFEHFVQRSQRQVMKQEDTLNFPRYNKKQLHFQELHRSSQVI